MLTMNGILGIPKRSILDSATRRDTLDLRAVTSSHCSRPDPHEKARQVSHT
ncbi:hypothetical protein GCM10027068_51340 [Prescottella soli]